MRATASSTATPAFFEPTLQKEGTGTDHKGGRGLVEVELVLELYAEIFFFKQGGAAP